MTPYAQLQAERCLHLEDYSLLAERISRKRIVTLLRLQMCICPEGRPIVLAWLALIYQKSVSRSLWHLHMLIQLSKLMSVHELCSELSLMSPLSEVHYRKLWRKCQNMLGIAQDSNAGAISQLKNAGQRQRKELSSSASLLMLADTFGQTSFPNLPGRRRRQHGSLSQRQLPSKGRNFALEGNKAFKAAFQWQIIWSALTNPPRLLSVETRSGAMVEFHLSDVSALIAKLTELGFALSQAKLTTKSSLNAQIAFGNTMMPVAIECMRFAQAFKDDYLLDAACEHFRVVNAVLKNASISSPRQHRTLTDYLVAHGLDTVCFIFSQRPVPMYERKVMGLFKEILEDPKYTEQPISASVKLQQQEMLKKLLNLSMPNFAAIVFHDCAIRDFRFYLLLPNQLYVRGQRELNNLPDLLDVIGAVIVNLNAPLELEFRVYHHLHYLLYNISAVARLHVPAVVVEQANKSSLRRGFFNKAQVKQQPRTLDADLDAVIAKAIRLLYHMTVHIQERHWPIRVRTANMSVAPPPACMESKEMAIAHLEFLLKQNYLSELSKQFLCGTFTCYLMASFVTWHWPDYLSVFGMIGLCPKEAADQLKLNQPVVDNVLQSLQSLAASDPRQLVHHIYPYQSLQGLPAPFPPPKDVKYKIIYFVALGQFLAKHHAHCQTDERWLWSQDLPEMAAYVVAQQKGGQVPKVFPVHFCQEFMWQAYTFSLQSDRVLGDADVLLNCYATYMRTDWHFIAKHGNQKELIEKDLFLDHFAIKCMNLKGMNALGGDLVAGAARDFARMHVKIAMHIIDDRRGCDVSEYMESGVCLMAMRLVNRTWQVLKILNQTGWDSVLRPEEVSVIHKYGVRLYWLWRSKLWYLGTLSQERCTEFDEEFGDLLCNWKTAHQIALEQPSQLETIQRVMENGLAAVSQISQCCNPRYGDTKEGMKAACMAEAKNWKSYVAIREEAARAKLTSKTSGTRKKASNTGTKKASKLAEVKRNLTGQSAPREEDSLLGESESGKQSEQSKNSSIGSPAPDPKPSYLVRQSRSVRSSGAWATVGAERDKSLARLELFEPDELIRKEARELVRFAEGLLAEHASKADAMEEQFKASKAKVTAGGEASQPAAQSGLRNVVIQALKETSMMETMVVVRARGCAATDIDAHAAIDAFMEPGHEIQRAEFLAQMKRDITPEEYKKVGAALNCLESGLLPDLLQKLEEQMALKDWRSLVASTQVLSALLATPFQDYRSWKNASAETNRIRSSEKMLELMDTVVNNPLSGLDPQHLATALEATEGTHNAPKLDLSSPYGGLREETVACLDQLATEPVVKTLQAVRDRGPRSAQSVERYSYCRETPNQGVIREMILLTAPGEHGQRGLFVGMLRDHITREEYEEVGALLNAFESEMFLFLIEDLVENLYRSAIKSKIRCKDPEARPVVLEKPLVDYDSWKPLAGTSLSAQSITKAMTIRLDEKSNASKKRKQTTSKAATSNMANVETSMRSSVPVPYQLEQIDSMHPNQNSTASPHPADQSYMEAQFADQGPLESRKETQALARLRKRKAQKDKKMQQAAGQEPETNGSKAVVFNASSSKSMPDKSTVLIDDALAEQMARELLLEEAEEKDRLAKAAAKREKKKSKQLKRRVNGTAENSTLANNPSAQGPPLLETSPMTPYAEQADAENEQQANTQAEATEDLPDVHSLAASLQSPYNLLSEEAPTLDQNDSMQKSTTSSAGDVKPDRRASRRGEELGSSQEDEPGSIQEESPEAAKPDAKAKAEQSGPKSTVFVVPRAASKKALAQHSKAPLTSRAVEQPRAREAQAGPLQRPAPPGKLSSHLQQRPMPDKENTLQQQLPRGNSGGSETDRRESAERIAAQNIPKQTFGRGKNHLLPGGRGAPASIRQDRTQPLGSAPLGTVAPKARGKTVQSKLSPGHPKVSQHIAGRALEAKSQQRSVRFPVQGIEHRPQRPTAKQASPPAPAANPTPLRRLGPVLLPSSAGNNSRHVASGTVPDNSVREHAPQRTSAQSGLGGHNTGIDWNQNGQVLQSGRSAAASFTAPVTVTHTVNDKGTEGQQMRDQLEKFCVCPITQEVMVDPVVAKDGHSYERKAICQWLEKHDTSPMTNEKLSSKDLSPNTILRQMICDMQAALQ